jgi:hypothetical protein
MMVTKDFAELDELPAFFKRVSKSDTLRPILISAEGIRGGFNLILEGDKNTVMVSDRGRPAWFGGVRDIIPILTDAYTLEAIADEAVVDLTGCF